MVVVNTVYLLETYAKVSRSHGRITSCADEQVVYKKHYPFRYHEIDSVFNELDNNLANVSTTEASSKLKSRRIYLLGCDLRVKVGLVY